MAKTTMAFQQELEAAQKHLAANDPVMAGLIETFGTPDINPHGDHYKQLLGSIIGQQLSVKAAASIRGRVLDFFGGQPTPQQLIDADKEKLRGFGLSYAKVNYVKDLAQHIIDGRLDMKHVSSLPNDELIDQLVAVKGIGVWSAHMFMIFGLGRLDILPVGDLGVRKGAMQLYKLRQLPSPARLEKLAKQNGWTPYQSIAAWYLWQSLDNSPK
jgi:DNA-3-methyladenine glycosylase II